MNKRTMWSGLAAVGLGLVCGGLPAAEPEGREKMLAHDVYFTLNESTPEAKAKLIAACQKYLTGHRGTVWFAAGPLGDEFQRDVNDRGFDVALHVVFVNKAAHDRYQEDERHLKFIEENSASWKSVRVFDSYVEVSSHAEMAREGVRREGERREGERREGERREGDRPEESRRLALPDPAAGFAGMVRGKVVRLADAGLVLNVAEVVKVWESNKAKDANALVGKNVLVDVAERDSFPARFVKLLKVGDEVAIDVANKRGETLTILELTEVQRERVNAAATER